MKTPFKNKGYLSLMALSLYSHRIFETVLSCECFRMILCKSDSVVTEYAAMLAWYFASGMPKGWYYSNVRGR